MSKESPNKTLLETVREANKMLEELPIHTHQKAVEALIVLGNHRLACAQQEQAELQRQAQIQEAFGGASRLITQ